jgi:predicted heme/steroid binding protein
MKIVEQIFEHKGILFKASDGRIYCQVFGTTIYDHSMHYSWSEVKKEIMTEEFKKMLKENKII